MSVRHPATFSRDVVEAMMRWMPQKPIDILDPLAGIGKGPEAFNIPSRGWRAMGIEMEEEWASQSVLVTQGDGIDFMTDNPGRFDVVATSPPFHNRMADNFTPSPSDKSRRNTYRHALGRELTDGNGASLQWTDRNTKTWVYRLLRSCYIALKEDGLLLLEMKDHIRGGERQYVTDYYLRSAMHCGMGFLSAETIMGKGLPGANSKSKIPYSTLLVMQK